MKLPNRTCLDWICSSEFCCQEIYICVKQAFVSRNNVEWRWLCSRFSQPLLLVINSFCITFSVDQGHVSGTFPVGMASDGKENFHTFKALFMVNKTVEEPQQCVVFCFIYCSHHRRVLTFWTASVR
ncbi:hypothetical protein PoB_005571800 [Plakobranchus ocellatus]|uniref:Uncharacterized protein n=1 Tax=Plakobranchus ocellatus TaxID=259542 RepID=A0AAV4CBH5_9GAST|nr:hypothetical protein PoB_005571800 [Plakobranchus ocellatus]